MEPNLKKYLAKFGTQPFVFLPALSTVTVMGCRGEILAHDGSIVVERVTFPPNTKILPHRHPSVSVADFGICGSGEFSVRHHKFSNDEYAAKRLPLVVGRNMIHGGIVGPHGATIISFQYWHTEPKESLFFDWDGAQ